MSTKNKKIFKYILSLWVLIYISFSFGMWDYNPSNWDDFSRAFCGVGLFTTAILTWVLVNMPEIR